jgi:UDP-2,3-diacylglucosamine pyrophosphatase LpxH
MPRTSIFVISDQHLGGAPAAAGRAGFEMCREANRARLAAFVDYVRAQHGSAWPAHLVINGDLVDFLAEEPFASFTESDEDARGKLRAIMERSAVVWDSLAAFLGAGGRLTILLGNHDLELSLPGPRSMLLDRLGPGRVEFVYDNQAFRQGPVLIEHGNRYDPWNVVSHDALRALRSAVSRREPAASAFPRPAGSELVTRVMNRIKQTYSFVDLLKPEEASVLPLLAVLHPPALSELRAIAQLRWRQARTRFDASGRPRDSANIAGDAGASVNEDHALLDMAAALAEDGAPANIAFAGSTAVREFAELWRLSQAAARDVQLRRLYQALKVRADHAWKAFDVTVEDERYLAPARHAARRGMRVVVMGHTHLVKRVPLDSDGAVYLNAGAWADLMRIPDAVLGGDETVAMRELAAFSDDIAANRLERWRRLVPTFARIDLDDGEVLTADVYFFDGPRRIARVPDGPVQRLSGTVDEPPS